MSDDHPPVMLLWDGERGKYLNALPNLFGADGQLSPTKLSEVNRSEAFDRLEEWEWVIQRIQSRNRPHLDTCR